MVKIGDKVYFSYSANVSVMEHVGVVYYIIPAGRNINNQRFGVIVSPSTAVRSTDTYVVSVKGTLFLTNDVMSVPISKRFLENEPRPYKKHAFYDRSDRITLETLARGLGDLYLMVGDSLYVPAWKKRFIFSVRDGVEYITRIEYVESDTNGVLVVK